MTQQKQLWVYYLMVAPGVMFLLVAFFAPVLTMLSSSFMTQSPQGIELPITFNNYGKLFASPLYGHVIWITLQMSVWTTLLALLIGFPIAMVIARGSPLWSRLAIIIVVAPLVVSVVIRTYGWSLILANNRTGVINWVLSWWGFGPVAVRLMYTPTAVVLGSLHVFLPMMVLPLAASISKVTPTLEEAAATLGASGAKVLWRVVLPLCKPGMLAGASVVFSLTAASFVTPAILGGSYALMLGNLVEQQILSVYDWPFGSALAVVMVLMIYGVNGVITRVFGNRRLSRNIGGA